MKYFLLIAVSCMIFTLIPIPPSVTPIETIQSSTATILLLPLDSRPVCTELVSGLGRIAGFKILLPPQEILDNYKQPADTKALRTWLLENAAHADAAILSIDMLAHGGLMASRHIASGQDGVKETLGVLAELRQNNPALPIYAFHILPRLWPAETEENNKYKKQLLQYSKLADQVRIFGDPEDTKELEKLRKEIPPTVLMRYQSLYEENLVFNKQLIALAQNKILTKLVIGQDDAHEFGIPNMKREQLLHYLQQNRVTSDAVVFTRGADEIAQNLLCEINGVNDAYHPKVYVEYSDDKAPEMIMPFMPNSVATTVEEKIKLVRGTIIDSPNNADFILFVHIGTPENRNRRFETNRAIQSLLKQNYKVALVDLSEQFAYEDAILPTLVNNAAPINRLIAYAGWNTTSNAVGTAVAQAALFTSKINHITNTKELLGLYESNLTFSTARYLDDCYYLKKVIDHVNQNLKAKRADVYHLGTYYEQANLLLSQEMNKQAYLLKNSKSYRKPFEVSVNGELMRIGIDDLKISTFYPWDRTFEIYLSPKIALKKFL